MFTTNFVVCECIGICCVECKTADSYVVVDNVAIAVICNTTICLTIYGVCKYDAVKVNCDCTDFICPNIDIHINVWNKSEHITSTHSYICAVDKCCIASTVVNLVAVIFNIQFNNCLVDFNVCIYKCCKFFCIEDCLVVAVCNCKSFNDNCSCASILAVCNCIEADANACKSIAINNNAICEAECHINCCLAIVDTINCICSHKIFCLDFLGCDFTCNSTQSHVEATIFKADILFCVFCNKNSIFCQVCKCQDHICWICVDVLACKFCDNCECKCAEQAVAVNVDIVDFNSCCTVIDLCNCEMCKVNIKSKFCNLDRIAILVDDNIKDNILFIDENIVLFASTSEDKLWILDCLSCAHCRIGEECCKVNAHLIVNKCKLTWNIKDICLFAFCKDSFCCAVINFVIAVDAWLVNVCKVDCLCWNCEGVWCKVLDINNKVVVWWCKCLTNANTIFANIVTCSVSCKWACDEWLKVDIVKALVVNNCKSNAVCAVCFAVNFVGDCECRSDNDCFRCDCCLARCKDNIELSAQIIASAVNLDVCKCCIVAGNVCSANYRCKFDAIICKSCAVNKVAGVSVAICCCEDNSVKCWCAIICLGDDAISWNLNCCGVDDHCNVWKDDEVFITLVNSVNIQWDIWCNNLDRVCADGGCWKFGCKLNAEAIRECISVWCGAGITIGITCGDDNCAEGWCTIINLAEDVILCDVDCVSVCNVNYCDDCAWNKLESDVCIIWCKCCANFLWDVLAQANFFYANICQNPNGSDKCVAVSCIVKSVINCVCFFACVFKFLSADNSHRHNLLFNDECLAFKIDDQCIVWVDIKVWCICHILVCANLFTCCSGDKSVTSHDDIVCIFWNHICIGDDICNACTGSKWWLCNSKVDLSVTIAINLATIECCDNKFSLCDCKYLACNIEDKLIVWVDNKCWCICGVVVCANIFTSCSADKICTCHCNGGCIFAYDIGISDDVGDAHSCKECWLCNCKFILSVIVAINLSTIECCDNNFSLCNCKCLACCVDDKLIVAVNCKCWCICCITIFTNIFPCCSADKVCTCHCNGCCILTYDFCIGDDIGDWCASEECWLCNCKHIFTINFAINLFAIECCDHKLSLCDCECLAFNVKDEFIVWIDSKCWCICCIAIFANVFTIFSWDKSFTCHSDGACICWNDCCIVEDIGDVCAGDSGEECWCINCEIDLCIVVPKDLACADHRSNHFSLVDNMFCPYKLCDNVVVRDCAVWHRCVKWQCVCANIQWGDIDTCHTLTVMENPLICCGQWQACNWECICCRIPCFKFLADKTNNCITEWLIVAIDTCFAIDADCNRCGIDVESPVVKTNCHIAFCFKWHWKEIFTCIDGSFIHCKAIKAIFKPLSCIFIGKLKGEHNVGACIVNWVAVKYDVNKFTEAEIEVHWATGLCLECAKWTIINDERNHCAVNWHGVWIKGHIQWCRIGCLVNEFNTCASVHWVLIRHVGAVIVDCIFNFCNFATLVCCFCTTADDCHILLIFKDAIFNVSCDVVVACVSKDMVHMHFTLVACLVNCPEEENSHACAKFAVESNVECVQITKLVCWIFLIVNKVVEWKVAVACSVVIVKESCDWQLFVASIFKVACCCYVCNCIVHFDFTAIVTNQFIWEVKLTGVCPVGCVPNSFVNCGDKEFIHFNDVFFFKIIAVHKVGCKRCVSVNEDINPIEVSACLLILPVAVNICCRLVFAVNFNLYTSCKFKCCDKVAVYICISALFTIFNLFCKGDCPNSAIVFNINCSSAVMELDFVGKFWLVATLINGVEQSILEIDFLSCFNITIIHCCECECIAWNADIFLWQSDDKRCTRRPIGVGKIHSAWCLVECIDRCVVVNLHIVWADCCCLLISAWQCHLVECEEIVARACGCVSTILIGCFAICKTCLKVILKGEAVNCKRHLVCHHILNLPIGWCQCWANWACFDNWIEPHVRWIVDISFNFVAVCILDWIKFKCNFWWIEPLKVCPTSRINKITWFHKVGFILTEDRLHFRVGLWVNTLDADGFCNLFVTIVANSNCHVSIVIEIKLNLHLASMIYINTSPADAFAFNLNFF